MRITVVSDTQLDVEYELIQTDLMLWNLFEVLDWLLFN